MVDLLYRMIYNVAQIHEELRAARPHARHRDRAGIHRDRKHGHGRYHIRPGGVHADVLYLCRRAPGPDADLAVHFPQGLMEGPVLLTGLKNGRKTTEKQFSEASDRFFMHWDRSPRHGSWNIHRCSRCLQRPPRGGQVSRAYQHRAGQGSPHSSGNVL